MKATKLHSDCSKDVIKQVIDGQDKYFRMCSKICLPRGHKDYKNYDKSGPDLPFNPVKHGCRNTQAHCVKNCSKSMIETDETGGELKVGKKVANYTKSKIFSVKDTTNMFGQNDNRLGGSKTAYKKNYKPRNPNKQGSFVDSDSIWAFRP